MPTIFFNHIPKTAGTSVRCALEKLFGKNTYNSYWCFDEYLADPKRHSYKLLCGHFGSVVESVHSRCMKSITFLREPSSRSVSHYLDIRARKTHRFHKDAQEMSFSDFIRSDVGCIELLDLQTRFLAVTDFQEWKTMKKAFDEVDVCTMKDLLHFEKIAQKALENLRKYFFVGVVERFNESLCLLSAQLNQGPIKMFDFNKAKESQPLQLSEEDRNVLMSLTRTDQLLYNEAQVRLATELTGISII